MINKISAKDRYHSHEGWLSTYHLFSFADYFDPNNMNFGVLRVFNDDTISGERGFGAHGHKDMEIITIVLEGELTHQDTMGNTKTISKGEVQYMSAGTGVMHSEINNLSTPVSLYQIWLTPQARNLHPSYDQKDFSLKLRSNALTMVASGDATDGAITIQADATIYQGKLEKDAKFTYVQRQRRGIFVYVTEGVVEINGILFETKDQARITTEETLTFFGKEKSSFVLVDVALGE
jgi:redox-sensitive bicupin YhaK (pirin superfamily)